MRSKAISDPEYRRIFNLLLIFKGASVVYALTAFYVAKQPITPYVQLVLAITFIYTAFFILFRNQVFDLLVKNAAYYYIDVLVVVFALLSTTKPSIPFYNFSAACMLTGIMIFGLRANLVLASILSLAQAGSAMINGLPISSSSGGIAMLIGEMFAYYVIALFGSFIAKLFKEVVAQRKIIKAQAEKEATIEERNRLAREIHDSIAQSFSGISLLAQVLKDSLTNKDQALEAENIDKYAKEGLQTVRTAIFSLRDDIFQKKSIAEIFTRYCAKLKETTGFDVEVIADKNVELSQSHKAELFRMGQEALNNCRKHSGKNKATLALSTSEKGLILKVTDSGNGFEKAAADGLGLGLKSMSERAKNIGAEFNIDSIPGEGTTIEILLSVSKMEKIAGKN